jgi:hypothetical protein
MFVGHFAVGFLGKRAAPRVPLAFLIFCTAFLDVLWPIFVLAGIEHARIAPGITAASPLDFVYYPWSHSVLAAVVWSALAALPWLLARRTREGLVVAACIFSHIVLDIVTHRADIPLAPGSDMKLGLGLWQSRAASVAVEGTLWVVALALYTRWYRPTSGWGRWGLWALVVVLTGAWLSGFYGPPPPSIAMVAGSALPFIALLMVWFWSIDRRRARRGTLVA